MPTDIVLTSYSDNLKAMTVTIASGASDSEIINPQGMALVGILMPAAWTAASIGYKAGVDGIPGNCKTVYGGGGAALMITIAVASQFIAFPCSDAIYAPWIILSSVTASTGASPVTQGGARTLTLIFRKLFN